MIILDPLLIIVHAAIELYIWAIIISAVLTWLVHFGVVNARNQFISLVGQFLWRLTEPALRPIRQLLGRYLPNLGGIDISPVVLLLVIILIQGVLGNVRVALHASGL